MLLLRSVACLAGLVALLSACGLPDKRTVRILTSERAVVMSGHAMMLSEDLWSLSLSSGSDMICKAELLHDAARRLEGPLTCSTGVAGRISLLFNNHRGFGTADIGTQSYLAIIGD